MSLRNSAVKLQVSEAPSGPPMPGRSRGTSFVFYVDVGGSELYGDTANW
jgi:hypothetical protein